MTSRKMIRPRPAMNICSFLPSATEIIYALGLESELCAVTHECDYPEAAKSKPKLTASAIEYVAAGSSSSQLIDSQVKESLASGKGIYSLDFSVLSKAAPDLIFTQELCEVCAVSYGEIYRAAQKLAKQPRIVSLDTFYLRDILEAVRRVGREAGKDSVANDLANSLEERINTTSRLCSDFSNGLAPKVFMLEWLDPIMCSGHWVSEVVRRAGGRDDFGKDGKNSYRVPWEQVKEYAPDYLIIAPCGFGVRKAEEEARQTLPRLDGWSDLLAVRKDQVFVADGNAYFSRPGPRIVDGLEILASILHPEVTAYQEKFGSGDFVKFSS